MNRLLLVLGLGFTTVSMNACDSIYWDESDSVAAVKAQKEIVVLTTQSPLTYSKSQRGEATGIDHDLVVSFAQHYDLKIRFVVLHDEDAVLDALAKGKGDFAATRLRTPTKNVGFLKGPAYEESYLSLYCHKKARVQHLRDLAGRKLTLLNKDNHSDLAGRLNQLAPQTTVEVVQGRRTQDIFKQVALRKTDCVIAESISGDFYNHYHSSIEKVTQISKAFSMSWLLAPHHNDLLHLMQAWFQKASRDDEIMRVSDRYKAYLDQLDRRDIAKFFKRIQTALPQYQGAFKKAARDHNLPWQLLASVAYQESHWNPDARSFTGVRGLMQLTTDTALHMGVEDRTDPLQSIAGGSKYLRNLYNRTPKSLNTKDRLALALAAYNVGSAHLRDAQKLAAKMGKNPHSWRQLREILPLLADPEYAAQLQYGPARGHETVQFVERVKSFYALMASAG